MKVLVACEFSGIVREAFRAKGHDALSCDLLQTEIPGNHYKGDVRDLLNDFFDLVIFHPSCRLLTNSGVRWFFPISENFKRWQELNDACDFFNLRDHFRANKIATENPIPHRYAKAQIGNYDQLIQPWQFGHGETKATCLWLKNLPKLQPTNIVSGREGRVWRMPPSENRWKDRSRTYSGIAEAMANQWG